MIVYGCFLLLWAGETSAQTGHGGYSFVKAGQLLAGVAYGGVVVDFDLTNIDKKAEKVQSMRRLFSNKTITTNTPLEIFHDTVMLRIDFALSRYNNMAGSMFPDRPFHKKTTLTTDTPKVDTGRIRMRHLDDLKKKMVEKKTRKRDAVHAVHLHENDKFMSVIADYRQSLKDKIRSHTRLVSIRRRKRQVMLAMAIGLMGVGCINSLLSDSKLSTMVDEVHNVENRQNQIMSWVSSDETAIKVNTDNLDLIRKTMLLENDQIAILILGTLVDMELQDFHFDMAMVDDVVKSAMDKKMVPRLLNDTTATNKLSEIERYAKRNGLSMMIDSITEMMQLDVGFKVGKRMISLILHIPLAKREHIFQLKKYVGMPLRTTNESMALITDPEGAAYLGWSVYNDYYITLTSAELHTCKKK
jgi:hypothetical protein